MDTKKIAKRGVIAAAILVGVVLLIFAMGSVTGNATDIWAKIPSWDWKQVAVACTTIIGFVLLIK